MMLLLLILPLLLLPMHLLHMLLRVERGQRQKVGQQLLHHMHLHLQQRGGRHPVQKKQLPPLPLQQLLLPHPHPHLPH